MLFTTTQYLLKLCVYQEEADSPGAECLVLQILLGLKGKVRVKALSKPFSQGLSERSWQLSNVSYHIQPVLQGTKKVLQMGKTWKMREREAKRMQEQVINWCLFVSGHMHKCVTAKEAWDFHIGSVIRLGATISIVNTVGEDMACAVGVFFFLLYFLSVVVFEQGVPIFAVWGIASERLVFLSTSKNNENISANSLYLRVH